jgi:hypothetical protein
VLNAGAAPEPAPPEEFACWLGLVVEATIGADPVGVDGTVGATIGAVKVPV